MKSISLISVLLLTVFNVAGQQDRTATTDDGKKVILRPDGTWAPVVVVNEVPPIKGELNLKTVAFADASEMAARLEKVFAKSEFETEAEYMKRIEKLAKDTSYSAAGPTVYNTIIVTDTGVNYDAEKRAFTFYAPQSIQLKVPNVLAMLTYKKRSRWGWTSGYPAPGIIPDLPMSPEKAKVEKQNIRIGVEGIPVEGNTRGTQLGLFPRRIIVFNAETKQIYSETPFTFL